MICVNKLLALTGIALAALPGAVVAPAAANAPAELDRYNVVWQSPSHDAMGSMPIGNGQVGLNVWVEENGDLRFYISRSDSLSEVAQLCKVGGVRVALTPNPFVAGRPFRQDLKLREGRIEITAGDVKLRVFVDVDHPVVYVTGESAQPVAVKATAECWRTTRHEIPRDGTSWTLLSAPFPLFESADVFPAGLTDAVVWYHRNETSTAFASTMKVQSLESIADKAHDPLLKRTFGGWMTGQGFSAVEGHALATPAPVKTFELRIGAPCAQTPTAQEWLDQARQTAAATPGALERTAAWWQGFWNRSWVIAEGPALSAPEIPGKRHPLRIGVDSNGENRFPGQINRTKAEFEPILKLEAWIKPNELRSGRIFDKMTAGGTDGFLLDTHPGDTLRFIVGERTFDTPRGILKAGQWHHVVATFDPATAAIKIWLNDKPLLTSGGPAVPVGQAYTLQRYVMACAGGGPYPIKFNGSIFTVEPSGKGSNPDWRKWGDCHWWQNVRFSYHAMLPGGDADLMPPLVALYESVRPLCVARAKLYHGVEGCYFPETMTVWGTYANADYGWDRTGRKPADVGCPYWQYAWNQGPELVALMLDRWDYLRDDVFLKEHVLPMAESVLKYFDTRFKRDADGRIVLDPTQAVETYWYEVVNDMPATAGLHNITARLTALPERLTTPAQRAFFARMKAACPVMPVKDGKLAPAQKYRNQTCNCENPELYAIFPFRLYGQGLPGLDAARAAYAARRNHLDTGWGYDGNCAALLGLTEEAARILKVKCANSNGGYRWPATWGPNYDWLPDQDHGANLLLTTQFMLLQCQGDKIRLFPAWPKVWDVSFRLHATNRTSVEAQLQGGKLRRLIVTPESRRKDVTLPDWLAY